MPSTAYRHWTTTRAGALNEIARAHVAVGGSGPGRRYATQQINQAYAVLLASQFQGFCRDLHSECVGHLVAVITSHPTLRRLVREEFSRGRQLDRGNAQPSSLGADFGRLGIAFWPGLDAYDVHGGARRAQLEQLNEWRNAIAHQDFDPARLGGSTTLQLIQVRRWRAACNGLARGFDEVLRRHLHNQTGFMPW